MHRQSEGVLSEGQNHVPHVHDYRKIRRSLPKGGLQCSRNEARISTARTHACNFAFEMQNCRHNAPEEGWVVWIGERIKKGDPVKNIITSCGPVSLLRCATTLRTADGASETH